MWLDGPAHWHTDTSTVTAVTFPLDFCRLPITESASAQLQPRNTVLAGVVIHIRLGKKKQNYEKKKEQASSPSPVDSLIHN